MKKWIIILIIFLFVLIVGVGIYAYELVREPLTNQFEQAKRYVVEQQLLIDIDEVDYYHGTDSFFVFKGNNNEGDEMIIWVSDQFDTHHTELAQNGLQEEEVISLVHSEGIVDIRSIRLGIERGLPVYEIIYQAEDGRRGYYYVTFEEGRFMKRYLLQN